ncbi:hypothetical protein GPECTOR_20g479 [Gonium pectorale]|uniref:Uncharacterized protein n=1 Tax=Gonium pectorale TaxID=33097 RepID=A0A150GII3_GONPE|nr:hypothetical protein GPECTOR_20g479 [Gonium pectorale]|eukprot:KXZ49622.1 hypothetical protein GPECTOR_20g479 [Gonium pectorale]
MMEGSSAFSQLPTELTELIARRLHPNEAATSFRLVNKAVAAQLRAPEHTVVRLSQPVPPHAFASHWLAPDATRGLNLDRRKLLLRLTAASGVVANLEVAVQAVGFDFAMEMRDLGAAAASAGSLDACRAVRLDGKLFRWAASSGSVELMAWLQERGCVWGDKALVGAAESGCEEAVEWLVERGCPLAGAKKAYGAAYRSGDLAMQRCLRWLDLAPGWSVRPVRPARHELRYLARWIAAM